MELHPLHVTLYAASGFRFLSDDDFRVGKQSVNFLVLTIFWISCNLFNLLAKFERGFLCIEQEKSVQSHFCWVFLIMTILSNASLTILESHSVGYWFSVRISWFFLRATSEDRQTLVAKNCTVPWIAFSSHCNCEQLRINNYACSSRLLIPKKSIFFFNRLLLSSNLRKPGLHYCWCLKFEF